MADSPETSIESLLRTLAVLPEVRWYHLADPSSAALDQLAGHFGIHPLQVEDCRHRRQTARVEEHDNYTFIVIKALHSGSGEPASERSGAGTRADLNSAPEGTPVKHVHAAGTQPSVRPRFEDFDVFLGHNYVLTVDEGACSLIPAVAKRVAADHSLRTPDRVVHTLVDAIVDQYLPALDQIGDFITHLEDRVLRRPSPTTLREIFRMKRLLLDFRRVATGMREAVNGLVRRYDSGAAAVRRQDRELRLYYRDVYDHIVRVLDFIETYRDLLTGSLDIYLSAVANRTNEIMKVLTIWGTIAIPFLVVTGFFGMNVDLPFQKNPHVLWILGATTGALALGIFWYFRRKHWF